MTAYEFPPGTRVRVTYEAEVSRTDANGDLVLLTDQGTWRSQVMQPPKCATVEILAPALPPEPAIDSVVLDRDGDAWQRYPDGLWHMAGVASDGNNWVDLEHPLRVIHDAGVSVDRAHARAAGNSEETRPPVAAVPVTPEPETHAFVPPPKWHNAFAGDTCQRRDCGKFARHAVHQAVDS